MQNQELIPFLKELLGDGGLIPEAKNSRIGRVIRRLRPAMVTHNGSLDFDTTLPTQLATFQTQAQDIVRRSSAGVGRIDVRRSDGSWRPVGTGWVTSSGDGSTKARIATAGHVVSSFLIAPGKLTRKFWGNRPINMMSYPQYFREARITFADNPDPEADGIQIKYMIWPHGLWDVALCELDRALPADAALPIETTLDWAQNGTAPTATPIAVFGYPMSRGTVDMTPEKVFVSTFGGDDLYIRRFSPGLIDDMSNVTGDPLTATAVEAAHLNHDASTLGGSSGSPVFSLETQKVVGIHRQGGIFDRRPNLAVPLALLFNDARMLDEMLNTKPKSQRAKLRTSRNPTFWSSDMGDDTDESRSPFIGAEVKDIPATLLTSVMADRPDDRDYFYRPSLGPLLDEILPQTDNKRVILNQRSEAACIGFALAALINDQCKRAKRKTAPVSARMLYEMARTHDEWIDDSADGTSLRAGIKGFFNSGVCTEKIAPFYPGDTSWRLTQTAAQAARSIRASAYYRLRQRLEDFQSAIQDVGAVAIAAHIHEGWIRSDGKRIHHIRHSTKRIGAHAFIAIGYDSEGFIIQNSWGPNWGYWDEQDGLAHWRYEDWAENLIDAWIIRLAPTSPVSFGLTPAIAQSQDRTLPDPISRLPRSHRYTVLGHIVHAERDGVIERGSMGLGIAPIREAAINLRTQDEGETPHLAVFYHDPFLGAAAVSRIAGYTTPILLKNGIFPLHVIYGADEVTTVTARLRQEIDLVARRFTGALDEATIYLERRAMLLGGRIWSDFADGAKSAAAPGGALWKAGAALCVEAAQGRSLSAVSFGAGDVAALAQFCATTATGKPNIDRLIRIAPVSQAPQADPKRQTKFLEWQLAHQRQQGELAPIRGDWCDLVAHIGKTGMSPRVARDVRTEMPGSLTQACVDPKVLNEIIRAITGRWPSRTKRFESL